MCIRDRGISTLSQSADKAYTQYVEAEEDKTIAQELENYLNNPNDEILTSLRSELGLDVLDEMEQSKLDEYAATGGDPLVVAKGRNYSNRVRREILKGKAAYFYQYKYSQLLDEAVRAEEDRLGRTMSSAELAGYMTEVGGIVAERFRTQGGMSLKPGSMRTALEYREKIHMNRLSTARSQEIKNELKRSADNATSILTSNPAEFERNIVSSFQMYRRANGNDFAAAHDWYESLYTMRGPDGKYLFTEEQLASTLLMGGEKPYAQQRPGRHAAGLRARMVDDTNYRKQQINAENVAFKEAEQNALEYIVESGGQKDVVEAAVAKFRDTYGRVPETINKYLENYTVEAQTKAKQIEYLQAIPDGFIRKEHVDSLKALDVKAGNDLEKRHAAQEAKYNSGVFKDQSDAFKTAANGVTSFGSQKPNNASSLFLQQEMRAEYRKRVDQAVAGGMEFNAAANTVAMQLTKEVETGSRDPNSLWYRKPSKAGGAADFPNLTGGNLTALEKARRNYQGIVKSVAENGLEKTLDTAESILTREEIVSIIAGYGKPGFVIPIDVRAVTGMGNGLDPFTVINRQINALGDPNLLPLELPAIIQNINDTMTEQERTSLFSGITGPLERARALQQGSSRLTGDVSRFTDSSSMRAGSPIRQAIGSRSEKALIQTIREVEGTAGERGYDTWFGGRTDMKMTDMTLQEVYDEQTRRMNAGETTYNGLSSAAVGVGQFMDPLNQARAMYLSLIHI